MIWRSGGVRAHASLRGGGERVLAAAQQKADAAPLVKELAEAQARIETLTQREVLRDELRQRKNTLNEEAASLRGANERLVPEVEPFKARIALLESSTEPLCPTCGQPL